MQVSPPYGTYPEVVSDRYVSLWSEVPGDPHDRHLAEQCKALYFVVTAVLQSMHSLGEAEARNDLSACSRIQAEQSALTRILCAAVTMVSSTVPLSTWGLRLQGNALSHLQERVGGDIYGVVVRLSAAYSHNVLRLLHASGAVGSSGSDENQDADLIVWATEASRLLSERIEAADRAGKDLQRQPDSDHATEAGVRNDYVARESALLRTLLVVLRVLPSSTAGVLALAGVVSLLVEQEDLAESSSFVAPLTSNLVDAVCQLLSSESVA